MYMLYSYKNVLCLCSVLLFNNGYCVCNAQFYLPRLEPNIVLLNSKLSYNITTTVNNKTHVERRQHRATNSNKTRKLSQGTLNRTNKTLNSCKFLPCVVNHITSM